jgi:polyisoprenoid-binding protein YceI
MPMTEAPGRTDAIAAGEWAIDAKRSSVAFTLKHLVFKKVKGSFHEFRGTLRSGGGSLSASGAVAAGSIDTGDGVRDQHLRDSADFFGVAANPEITFDSTLIELHADGTIRVTGELRMRGVTRGIELRGTLTPLEPAAGEPEVIELRIAGEIDRGDFGLTWNQKLDTGGALLGNRVKIDLMIVAARTAAA